MRWIAIGLLVLGACGSSMAPPPSEHAADGSGEWALLHAAVASPDELGPLATYYDQLGAWDEYSAVRSLMLARVTPGPGPAPGGPFPRIGVPRDHEPAPTILSRWLNRLELPELFEEPEVSVSALEAQLRAAPPTLANRLRLASVLAVRLELAEAAGIYTSALAEQRGADADRTRHHLDDARRILDGR